MSKKIALLAVAGAVAILGAGVLGYFSYGWINPPEPPPVTLSKGNVRGKVLTDSGSMTPAGIIVEDEEGNTQRLTTNAFGGYDLQLYPGKYRLTFTKGYEFDTVTKEVEVQQYKTYYLQDVRLMQLYDSYEKHWIAGDLHQHTYYSDGSDSILSLALGDVSVGLYYAFLSDHNSARGLAEWYETDTLKTLTAEDGEDRFFTPGEAVEITTEFGHFQALGVATTLEKYDVELYESERNSPDRDQIIMDRITYIANCIKRDGGVAQINHPYSVSTMGFNYWELAPLFDTVEIWNGVFNPGDGRYENETGYISQNYESKLKWYELLNEGLYLAATGGTDIHDTKGPGKTGGVTAITGHHPRKLPELLRRRRDLSRDADHLSLSGRRDRPGDHPRGDRGRTQLYLQRPRHQLQGRGDHLRADASACGRIRSHVRHGCVLPRRHRVHRLCPQRRDGEVHRTRRRDGYRLYAAGDAGSDGGRLGGHRGVRDGRPVRDHQSHLL